MNIKNYDEAKKIFLDYDGSYFHMHREGVLSDYRKFNIPKKMEIEWLKEKIEEILSKVNEEKSIKEKYHSYWNILYILTKTLEDDELLKKTIKTFEKDLMYLDVFSINSILKMILNNKSLWEKVRHELKEILVNYDINKNEIISKELNETDGVYNLTEKEVIERYRNILIDLD